MNRLCFYGALALTIGASSGCVTNDKAAKGHQVRSIMYSQMVAPEMPRAVLGSNGAAAAAAYSNFQKSYVTPVPQGENLTFGSTQGN